VTQQLGERPSWGLWSAPCTRRPTATCWRASTQALHPTERRYSDAEGSNRLIISTQGDVAPTLAQSMQSAWYYHPNGVPLAQFQWPTKGPATNRRTVYSLDR